MHCFWLMVWFSLRSRIYCLFWSFETLAKKYLKKEGKWTWKPNKTFLLIYSLLFPKLLRRVKHIHCMRKAGYLNANVYYFVAKFYFESILQINYIDVLALNLNSFPLPLTWTRCQFNWKCMVSKIYINFQKPFDDANSNTRILQTDWLFQK